MSKHNFHRLLFLIITVLFFGVAELGAQEIAGGAPARPTPRRTFRLQLEVTAGGDKVEGARVLLVSEEAGVRFSKETRTNQNGIATASSVPEGRIKVQVIAKQCETYGSLITVSQDQMVQVALIKQAPTPSPVP
ncbi:MAG: hypothetical protein ACR2H6_02050 [Pyrinomonadaceae bacterium]